MAFIMSTEFLTSIFFFFVFPRSHIHPISPLWRLIWVFMKSCTVMIFKLRWIALFWRGKMVYIYVHSPWVWLLTCWEYKLSSVWVWKSWPKLIFSETDFSGDHCTVAVNKQSSQHYSDSEFQAGNNSEELLSFPFTSWKFKWNDRKKNYISNSTVKNMPLRHAYVFVLTFSFIFTCKECK